MKKLLPLTIVILATACGLSPTNIIEKQANEAAAARKRSDSILQEFKRVNNSLQQSLDSIQQSNDSLLRKYDSALIK